MDEIVLWHSPSCSTSCAAHDLLAIKGDEAVVGRPPELVLSLMATE